MQTRPTLSLLVFALAGCVGDNDVEIHGGGDGGGSMGADDMSDPEDGSDEDGDDGLIGPDDGESSGGDSSGGPEVDPFGDPGDGPVCGDGLVASIETCDDGNIISGDGCDADCRVTEGVESFALGGDHTCVVDYHGKVRCWGDNESGQLGYGSPDLKHIGATITPAAFKRNVEIGQPIEMIATGKDHTCALTVGGAVFCWGRNDDGQLGYGHRDTIGDDETPESVGPIPFGKNAASIAAGRSHTCAVFDDGELACWGDGGRGQLGIGGGFIGRIGAGILPYPHAITAPGIPMLSGLAVDALASGTGEFSCIIDDAYRMRCWGANDFGQLGLGHDRDMGAYEPAMQSPAQVDARVMEIGVGTQHTCLISSVGDVYCVGRNDEGQLGYGHKEPLGDDEPMLGRIDLGGKQARKVVAGVDFSCALLVDGSVRCWGSGQYGKLGAGSMETIGDDETPADAPTFLPVQLLLPATDIAAGAHHTCARTPEAALRCWGSGMKGRLGYGTEEDRGGSPATLPILPVPIF